MWTVLFYIIAVSAAGQPAIEHLLQTQTQELMDALAPGTASVWNRYLDDEAIVSDENGTVQTKAELMKDFRGLRRPRERAYAGVYALTPEITYEIRWNGDQLEGRRTGRKWETLKAEAPDVLFVPGQPRYRKIMQRDAAHKVIAMAERREAWDVVWKRLP